MEVRAFDGPLPAAKTGFGLCRNDACLLSRGWRCHRRAGRRSSRKRSREPSDPQQRAWVSEMLREETEEGILQAVERLRERNLLSRVHDYTSVVIAFSRKHYWERACDVLSEMHYRSLAAKPVAYNNAMNACLSRENWQQPLRLLREMRERAVPCDLFSYTNALTASGRMGMWQEALRLLWNMVGDKVAPDIVAFNAALAACESAGRWQWSLQLTKALGQAKLQPDDVTYRSITRALEAAEQQLRELRLELPSPVSPGGPSHQGPAQLHYCLVQCDEQGLEGWSLAAGSKHRRWDTLLLGLLQCFMMDGQWLRNVAASLLVGPDAVHATGALQPLVMTVLGQGQDGRPFYQPATLKAFEEALWKRRGQDAEGLCWQRAPHRPKTRLEAQGMLLESLDELVGEAPAKAGVLAFDAGAVLTYDELQESGWTGSYDKLFVLLGGAHGFDGADDVDGRFLGEVLGRFEARVGTENVAKVTLADDASASVATTFPLSKVVSFISVEHCRGTLFASKRSQAVQQEAGREGKIGSEASAFSESELKEAKKNLAEIILVTSLLFASSETSTGTCGRRPFLSCCLKSQTDETPARTRVRGGMEVPEAIPEDFVLGLVLAVSGGGKTRSLRALRRERGLGAEDGLDLRDEALPPVADPRFASAEAAVSRLSAAGLSSVPAWCQPFWTLSHGEQCRAECAAALKDGALLDDFGAFTASGQTQAAAAALSRFVRSQGLRKIVVAASDMDLVSWLAPDWVWLPRSREVILMRASWRPKLEFCLGSTWAPEARWSSLFCTANLCERTVRSCEVQRHPRLALVEERFDFRSQTRVSSQLPMLPGWLLEEDLPGLGIVFGPSGSGKTTVLQAFQEMKVCPPKVPTTSQGLPPDVRETLGLVEEPHSAGELHQYAVADALWHGGSTVVLDELGSQLDAASRRRFCAGLRKLLQKGPLSFKRVVAATLHPDMVDLLRPRWMLDTASATLWRSPAEPEMGEENSIEQLGDSEMPRFEAEQVRKGFVQPMLKLKVSLLHADGTRAWRRFARHHYLSSQLSPAATCAEVHWGDEPVAFLALLPREAASGSTDCREHRLVVLPDFQGLGIGLALSEFMAELATTQGFFGCVPPQRYFSSTAHFHLGSARARSPLWASTPFDGSEAARPGDTRLLFKHMYVGKGPAASKALPEKGDGQENAAGYTGTAFRDSPHNNSAAVLRPRKLKRRGRQEESTQIDCTTVGEAIKVQVVEDRLAFWATTSPGLEDVVADEARRKIPELTIEEKKGSGRICLCGTELQDLKARLEKLLAADRIYVQVARVSGLRGDLDAKLRQLAADPALGASLHRAARFCLDTEQSEAAPWTFRVTCRRSGPRIIGSDAAAAALAAGIEASLGWRPELQNFELELVLWLQPAEILLGMSLGRQGATCLLAPERRAGLAELKSSLSYAALARCVGEAWVPGQLLVDPMCGSLAPVEVATGSEFGKLLFCLCGDISEAAMATSGWNRSLLPQSRRARIDLVRWDARRLPLRAFCADRLLLHPPAGKFFGAPQAHARLYAASLDECRRVLRPRGRGQRGAHAPRLALQTDDRVLADKALPVHAAGANEGCIVRTSKDLGIAWVRHAETRLLFEGDASLMLLSTCVKPLRQDGSVTNANRTV
ncbi:Thumpd3 [Symbiodinium sp. CCMP2456]|nr:Thumpd3 [Symbiodinium sp. CCMP2456]